MAEESIAQKQQLEVIDVHCHVASLDMISRSFVDGVIDNVSASLSGQGIRADRKKIAEMYLTKMNDPLCDELVQEMDAAGISKSVLLAPDFTFALKDAKLTIAEILERHKRVLDRHPDRFLVFGGVDPRWGKDGLDLFERSVSVMGFHGLKVYPPCGFSPSDRSLFPYYEICAQWGLPALVHIGATSPALGFDTAQPILVDQAARAFPTVNFILAHGSVAYVEECAMLCSHRPNVYLDVSGFQTADLVMLQQVFRRGIQHKVLFGTDWPLFRLQGTQKEFLAKLTDEDGPLGDLKQSEIRAFLGRGAATLLSRKRREPPTAEPRISA